MSGWPPPETGGRLKAAMTRITANNFIYEKIATQLAETELNAGHPQQAIQWFEAAQKVSNTPDALQKRIDEIKKQMATTTNAPAAMPH